MRQPRSSSIRNLKSESAIRVRRSGSATSLESDCTHPSPVVPRAFRFLDIREGTDLYVEQLVSRGIGGKGGILFSLEGIHQRGCIFLLTHRCHLYKVAALIRQQSIWVRRRIAVRCGRFSHRSVCRLRGQLSIRIFLFDCLVEGEIDGGRCSAALTAVGRRLEGPMAACAEPADGAEFLPSENPIPKNTAHSATNPKNRASIFPVPSVISVSSDAAMFHPASPRGC